MIERLRGVFDFKAKVIRGFIGIDLVLSEA